MSKIPSQHVILLITLFTTLLFPAIADAEDSPLNALRVTTIFEHHYLHITFDIDDSPPIKKLVFYQAEQVMKELNNPRKSENFVSFAFLPGANTVEVKIVYNDGKEEWRTIRLSEYLFPDFFKNVKIRGPLKDCIFPLVYLLNIVPDTAKLDKNKYIRFFRRHFKSARLNKYPTLINNERVLSKLFNSNHDFYLDWLLNHEALLNEKTGKILAELSGEILGDSNARKTFFKAFCHLIHRRMNFGLTMFSSQKGKEDEVIPGEIEKLKNAGARDLLVPMAKLFFPPGSKTDPTGFYYNNGYYFLKKAALLDPDEAEALIDYLEQLVLRLENTKESKERIRKNGLDEPEIYSYTYDLILDDLEGILPELSGGVQEKAAELVVHMALSKKIDDRFFAGDIYNDYIFLPQSKSEEPTKTGHPGWFYNWLVSRGDALFIKKKYDEAWKLYNRVFRYEKGMQRSGTFLINSLQCLFILKKCDLFAEHLALYGNMLPKEYRQVFSQISGMCNDDRKIKDSLNSLPSGWADKQYRQDTGSRRARFLRHTLPSLDKTLQHKESFLKRRTPRSVASQRKKRDNDFSVMMDKGIGELLDKYVKSPIKGTLKIQLDYFSDREAKAFEDRIREGLDGKVTFQEGYFPLGVGIVQSASPGLIEVRLIEKLGKKKYFNQFPVGTDDIDSKAQKIAGFLCHWVDDLKNDTALSFRKAASYTSEENWEKALIEFENLYNYFNRSPLIEEQLIDVYDNLSLQLLETDPGKAIEYTNKALNLLEARGETTREKHIALNLRLARLFRRTMQPRKAADICEKLAEEFPKNRNVQREYMFSVSALDKKEAKVLLTNFLKTHESLDPVEEAVAASIYSRLKNHAKARKHGENAFQNSKGNDNQVNNMYGTVLIDCGYPLQARHVIQEGLELDPKHPVLCGTMGKTLLRIGEFSEAIIFFKKNTRFTRTKIQQADSFCHIGLAYLMNDKFDDGCNSIEESNEQYLGLTSTASPSIHYNKGMLYNSSITGDLENASRLHREIESGGKNAPKDTMGEVEYYMAGTFLLNNWLQEAMTHLGRANGCEPENTLYLYQLALVSDLLNPNQAGEYLTKAVKRDKEDHAFSLEHLFIFPIEHKHYLIALAAEEQKRMSEALNTWKQLETKLINKIKACDTFLDKNSAERKKENQDTVLKYKKHYQVLKKNVILHREKLSPYFTKH